MDYSQFLTPAIGAGLFVYLANFFGKVMADQMPVVDDRKWQVQIGGVMFMTNLVTGLIGVYFAVTFPWSGWWLHLVTMLVLGIVYASLYSYSLVKGSEAYKYRTKELAEADPKYKETRDALVWTGEYMATPILPIITFYFGTLEFLSGNVYWTIASGVFIFLMLTQYAYITSLKKWEEPVTVYFAEKGREPLKGVTIIKEKEDSYRLRVDNKIILLSKSEVASIEMVIPNRQL